MSNLPDDVPFAALVREGMSRAGFGLRELCRAVRLDPSFLSKVLAGRRSPPSEEAVLRQIAATLGLDAPRLIVAAGRIPSEWRRLWSDPGLFASVHGQVAGRLTEPKGEGMPPPRPGGRPTERYREEVPPPRPWKRPAAPDPVAFGEELL